MSGMGERLIGMGKYRKSRAFSPEGFFECEGRGLKWLGEAQSQGGPRVVDVYDWGKDYLDIERVNACGPTIQAARDFGVALAHMHDAGAEHFGSAPTGYDGTCYFGPLQDPVPMDTGAWDDVATYLADGRLRPMVRLGMKRRELTDYDMELTEAVIDALPDILGKAPTTSPHACMATCGAATSCGLLIPVTSKPCLSILRLTVGTVRKTLPCSTCSACHILRTSSKAISRRIRLRPDGRTASHYGSSTPLQDIACSSVEDM